LDTRGRIVPFAQTVQLGQHLLNSDFLLSCGRYGERDRDGDANHRNTAHRAASTGAGWAQISELAAQVLTSIVLRWTRHCPWQPKVLAAPPPQCRERGMTRRTHWPRRTSLQGRIEPV